MNQIKLIHMVLAGAAMISISVFGLLTNNVSAGLLANDILTVVGTIALTLLFGFAERTHL